MAYASAVALTPVEPSRAGLSVDKSMVVPTATHGNKFPNDQRTVLHVRNDSASPITVTINTPRTIDGQSIDELVVTVPAVADVDGKDDLLIGPFTETFSQSDGNVWVVCSAVTDVLIGALRLPR